MPERGESRLFTPDGGRRRAPWRRSALSLLDSADVAAALQSCGIPLASNT